SHLYHTYMAHNRYKTNGELNYILSGAHPQVIGGKIEERGDHVFITNCEMAAVHNGQIDIDRGRYGLDDKCCDTLGLLHFYRENGEDEIIKRIPGSYTFAIADAKKEGVIVARDSHGIKPGFLGIKDGKYYVASESTAFRDNGGELVDDLIPGSVYYLTPDGSYQKKMVVEPKPQECFFEWNYIAHPHSVLNNLPVRTVRKALGIRLAQEFRPKDIDLVTFVPRCPEIAAQAYADATGVKFLPLFYKIRGERSFQGPTKEERLESINKNLYLIRGLDNLSGKNVLVVDDSLIRGNVVKRVWALLKNAGVKKGYFASYTPPIGIIGDDNAARGCMFGVDMPPNDNFIARGKTLEQISQEVGMEVYYLSKKGMFEVYGNLAKNPKDLCSFCIGGKHPFS
ncbi:MAG: hypothetical protein Q7S74_04145, partial [Nanoarchaeota archaeon]|nr:hypothetical protein [Nanoarchaeota archaeon]